ncbi:hypothetical protein [Micromonospora carbonacea]|uniref:hypothetical protein n=1 Tax=Micromonospora carbonacea TaxID=47853 RepID=UPI00114CA86E|nr:hypothetical protein [Micromonospora carbonacea]
MVAAKTGRNGGAVSTAHRDVLVGVDEAAWLGYSSDLMDSGRKGADGFIASGSISGSLPSRLSGSGATWAR